MDPYEFEYFVGDVWEDRGWETDVSQGSNDMGVDVIARKSDGLVEQKAVIQAKRYSEGNKVGRPKIQQYHSLKEQDSEADAAVVVTTSAFTRGAERWGKEHNVKLIDGSDLVEIVEERGLNDLLDEYAPPLSEMKSDTQDEANSSDPSPQSVSTSSSSSYSDYLGLVSLGFLVQMTGFALVLSPSLVPAISADIASGMLVLGWFGLPPIVFADALDLHKSSASYQPNRLTWPIVMAFLPVIGPLLYLNKRMKALG